VSEEMPMRLSLFGTLVLAMTFLPSSESFAQCFFVGSCEEDGRWVREDGSYVDIQSTDDGHIVEIFYAKSEIEDVSPLFGTAWESSNWSKITFDKISFSPIAGCLGDEIRFRPFLTESGIHLREGDSIVLQPRQRGPSLPPYSIRMGRNDSAPCGSDSTLMAEYSLTPIDPPLVGDFNFDEMVDFEDFTLLQASFGQRLTFWHQGDANLDRSTGFVDFLMLSNNFGESREAGALVVPEPSARLLLVTALVLLSAVVRKKNGVQFSRASADDVQ